MEQYLAQFTGTKLMTSEMVGTKAQIEAWVDANRSKFKGETIRIWPVLGHRQFGKMLGERVVSA